MRKQNKDRLEVQIIRNVSCLEFGRNNVWCDILAITPPREEGDKTRGMIRAYKKGSLGEIFTRFYHPNEKIDFKLAKDGTVGSLMVEKDTYFARSKGKSAGELIVQETKRFEGGYDELDNYIMSLC